MAQLNMDLGNTEAQTAYEVLPAGDYMAQIIESEIKEAKSGTHYIKLTWEVMDQKFRGRKVFQQVTLSNQQGKRYDAGSSPAEIGARTMKTIAVCGNHPNPNFLRDSEELHNLPMLIKVKIKDDQQYGPQNNISGYRPLNAAPAPLAPNVNTAAPPAFTPPPVGGGAQVPPWMQAAR